MSKKNDNKKKKLNLKVKKLESKTAPRHCKCATSPVIGAS